MTVYDEKFIEVMGRDVEGTPTLKMLDLYLLGEALLNAVGTCILLGHASPANSVIDYTTTPDGDSHVSKHILRDLLAWQSGRRNAVPGCEERLRGWVTTDWLPKQMAHMEERLTPERES